MKWNFKWGNDNKQVMTPELTERGVNVYHHENKIKNADKLTQEKVEPVVTTNERKENSMEIETITRGGKPWTPPVKTCPACGKQFVAASNRQVYCSDECQRNAYAGKKAVKTTPSGFKYVSTAPTRPIKCEICGKSFVPRTKRGKYCSDECRKEAARRISREWDAAHRSSDAGVKLKRVTVAGTAPQYESNTNIHLEVATVVRKLVEAGVEDEIVAKYLQTYYGSK